MQSATSCLVSTHSGGVAALNEAIIAPLSLVPLDTTIRFSSRSGYRNCGNGPYFNASKVITRWDDTSGASYNVGRRYVFKGYIGYYGNVDNYYDITLSWRSRKTYCNIYHNYITVWQNSSGDWYGKQMESYTGTFLCPFQVSTLTVEIMESLLPYSSKTYKQRWSQQLTRSGSVISNRVKFISPIGGNSLEFKFHELQVFTTYMDLGILTGGMASRFASAYTEAANAVGDSSINTLANAFELIEGIRALLEGLRDPMEALSSLMSTYKDPRKAWLMYRYSYSTTKSDLSEYSILIERIRTLSRLVDKDIHSTGSFSDETGSYRVEMRISTSTILPTTLSEWLAKFGFEPNLQNLWDIVPYSFVVDWFLHFSDLLELFDDWTYSLSLEPSESWFTYVNSYDSQEVFFRIPGRKINVPPHYTVKAVSGKTWRLRLADSISLFS